MVSFQAKAKLNVGDLFLDDTWILPLPSSFLLPEPNTHPFFCLLPLQDMQVTGVEDDSRALNITIHKPASSPHSKPFPILQATFVFSDHIRCIIAKQRLAKGRIQARRMKMQRIAGEWLAPAEGPLSEPVGGTGAATGVLTLTLTNPHYSSRRRHTVQELCSGERMEKLLRISHFPSV